MQLDLAKFSNWNDLFEHIQKLGGYDLTQYCQRPFNFNNQSVELPITIAIRDGIELQCDLYWLENRNRGSLFGATQSLHLMNPLAHATLEGKLKIVKFGWAMNYVIKKGVSPRMNYAEWYCERGTSLDDDPESTLGRDRFFQIFKTYHCIGDYGFSGDIHDFLRVMDCMANLSVMVAVDPDRDQLLGKLFA